MFSALLLFSVFLIALCISSLVFARSGRRRLAGFLGLGLFLMTFWPCEDADAGPIRKASLQRRQDRVDRRMERRESRREARRG